MFERWFAAREAEDVDAAFSPHFDASVSPDGVAYGCEIRGPYCGYDSMGSQTWDEFVAVGPPQRISMPAWIAAEIRAYALARKRT